MLYKWVGAFLIIAGCGGTGFSIASNIRKEEICMQQLTDILMFMENELQFRLTPLPELCHLASMETRGELAGIFENLSDELENQVLPDPSSCMASVLEENRCSSPAVKRLLLQLGSALGRFDLAGQIKDLHMIRKKCGEELHRIRENRNVSLKSYQTLGLCAGTALAVLLL